MSVKPIVMSRVRAIHFMQPFVSGWALSVLVLIAALYGIGRFVWVAKVVENMPSALDVLAFANFFLAAFLNTHVFVQTLTLAVMLAAVYVAREAAKFIAPTLTPARVSI